MRPPPAPPPPRQKERRAEGIATGREGRATLRSHLTLVATLAAVPFLAFFVTPATAFFFFLPAAGAPSAFVLLRFWAGAVSGTVKTRGRELPVWERVPWRTMAAFPDVEAGGREATRRGARRAPARGKGVGRGEARPSAGRARQQQRDGAAAGRALTGAGQRAAYGPGLGCTSLMLSLLPLSELAVKVGKCGRRPREDSGLDPDLLP